MKPPSWTACCATAVLGALLALAGCGPGVGGTGTGGAALTTFGASAASVCSSSFALELGCAQAPAPAPSSAAGSGPGTLPVQFVDASGHVTLDVNGNAATLQSSCLQLRFDGEFGRSAGGEAFFGSAVAADGAALASLSVASVAGPGLIVELRDVDGKPLLGPVVLNRAAAPMTAPAGC
ncbi:MAG: hypothetical protein JO090_04230 [Rhizobacter sp.]|nr:hypothetical protein [Rhizobacter sp.]